jgi:hypothetical protein
MSSEEVNSAVGAGPEREKNRTVSEVLIEKQAKLAEARERYQTAKQMRDEESMSVEGRTIDSLVTLIAELEKEAAEELEADAVRRATKRMVAISRAAGSIANELDEDQRRVDEKMAELQEAIARLNGRYTKATQLRAEAAALSDRFGVDKPALPNLVPPARRDFVTTLANMPRDLLDHRSIRQPVEECEHRLRTRRTYREVEGTPSFDIIEAAGLKPFAPLTEKQQEIVGGRERQAERTRRSFEQHAGVAPERSWGKS